MEDWISEETNWLLMDSNFHDLQCNNHLLSSVFILFYLVGTKPFQTCRFIFCYRAVCVTWYKYCHRDDWANQDQDKNLKMCFIPTRHLQSTSRNITRTIGIGAFPIT